jgi:hypothetical protein
MSILCQPWSNHHPELVCSICIKFCREGRHSASLFLPAWRWVVALRRTTPGRKGVARWAAAEFKDEAALGKRAARLQRAAAHHRREGLAPERGPIPRAAWWLRAEREETAEPPRPVGRPVGQCQLAARQQPVASP